MSHYIALPKDVIKKLRQDGFGTDGSGYLRSRMSESTVLSQRLALAENETEISVASLSRTDALSLLSPEQLKLRNTLLLAHEQKGVRSVLITGTSEGVGVTSLAAAMAIGLSWDPKLEILLIEANWFRPRLHQILPLAEEENSAESLNGSLPNVKAAGFPNLHVMAAHRHHAVLPLEARRLAASLPSLCDTFDFVIIDAPPVSLHADLLLLCSHLDSVVLVAEAGRTRIKELHETISELNRVEAKLLGVVLNREKNRLPAAFSKWL